MDGSGVLLAHWVPVRLPWNFGDPSKWLALAHSHLPLGALLWVCVCVCELCCKSYQCLARTVISWTALVLPRFAPHSRLPLKSQKERWIMMNPDPLLCKNLSSAILESFLGDPTVTTSLFPTDHHSTQTTRPSSEPSLTGKSESTIPRKAAFFTRQR